MKRRPKRSYSKHLNAVIAQMIRDLYFSRHMNQSQLAAFFHTHQGHISKIVSGQIW
jgi:predicted XRE-type DNA-binding protein